MHRLVRISPSMRRASARLRLSPATSCRNSRTRFMSTSTRTSSASTPIVRAERTWSAHQQDLLGHRITHLPTGIDSDLPEQRSQFRTRTRLCRCSRPSSCWNSSRRKRRTEIRGVVKDNGWGSQIRSYTALHDGQGSPHGLFDRRNVDAVLDGDLDDFMTAYLTWVSLGKPDMKGAEAATINAKNPGSTPGIFFVRLPICYE